MQGDASPEALAWGVPHRRQLRGGPRGASPLGGVEAGVPLKISLFLSHAAVGGARGNLSSYLKYRIARSKTLAVVGTGLVPVRDLESAFGPNYG